MRTTAPFSAEPLSAEEKAHYSSFGIGPPLSRGEAVNSAGASALGWPSPDMTLLHPARSAPPAFPSEVFGAWADWIAAAAEGKSCSPDYVAAGLLASGASLIGNARWASVHPSWQEPTVLWLGVVGDPSAGKSPGLDAATGVLRKVEREARDDLAPELTKWHEEAAVAKIIDEEWQKAIRKAVAAGDEPPPRPSGADPGEEPWLPRLLVNDATIERVATILSRQPKGALLSRDELAGWLCNMERNAKGGSDRPFWLEAYGGRGYVVERQTRNAVRVDHLSVSILGGIQPDRLASLLLASDDDGLPARLVPIWPTAAPLRSLSEFAGKAEIADALTARAEGAFRRLRDLRMPCREDGGTLPWLIPLDDGALRLLDDVRAETRSVEEDADGLLKSFVGKVPGVTVRLALVLAYLDWSLVDLPEPEPERITAEHLGRAAHFALEYAVPMARRAYAEAAVPVELRGAHRLAKIIADERLPSFTPSSIVTKKRQGLRSTAEVKAALSVMVDAGWVRAAFQRTATKPRELYEVNPTVLGAA